MRRQRLLTLTLVSFLLLCLTVICANASWFIQDKNKGSGSATNVGSALQEGEQNPIFQTTYTYTGNELTLEYRKDNAGNSLGQDLFGDSSENLEIVCNSAKASGASRSSLGDRFNSLMKDQDGNYLVKHAGTYTISIKDKTTGQMIYTDLTVVINPIQVEYTTPIPAYTFEEEYGTVTYQMQYTNAAGTVVTLDTVYSATTTGKVAAGAYGAGKTGTTPPTAEAFLNFTLDAQISEEITIAGGSTAINPAFNNYISPTSLSYQNFKFLVLPTCYTYANSTATFYGSLDAAFVSSNNTTLSNTTLVAMAGFTYNGTNYVATGKTTGNYTHKITGIKTIASGATLILPYGTSGTTFKATESTLKRDISKNANNVSKDATTLETYTICVNRVTLDGTLNNNGSITIGGVLGVPNGNVMQGVTSGNFAMLRMVNGATLNTSNTLKVYGYITTDGSNANVYSTSGSITMPFVVYDYTQGGVVTPLYLSGGLSPINLFDMPNIHATLTCTGGAAEIIGCADLYTYSLDKHNLTDIYIFGHNNSAEQSLITMSNGTAVFKYTPTTATGATETNFGINSNSAVPRLDAHTEIYLNGDTSSGNLTMEVNVGLSIPVALTDVKFPVSHKISLHLQGAHNYIFNSIFKFMPGSSLNIEKDAKVLVNENAGLLFYDAFTSTAERKSQYEATALFVNYYKTGIDQAAQCNVAGELTVNGSIGGKITPTTTSAKINLSQAQSLSIVEQEGNGSDGSILNLNGTFTPTLTETGTAQGYSLTSIVDGTPKADTIALSKQKYVVYPEVLGGKNSLAAVVTVSFDAGGGTVTPSSKDVYLAADGYYLYTDISKLSENITVTKDGLNFLGWYTDAALSTALTSREQISGTTKLYAKWEEALSTIVFDSNGKTAETFPNASVAYGTYTLPSIGESDYEETINRNVEKNYYLIGWATEANGTPVSSITVDEETEKVYAIWGTKSTISVSSSSVKGDNNSSVTYSIFVSTTNTDDNNYYKTVSKTNNPDDTSGLTWYIHPDHYYKFTISGNANANATDLPPTTWVQATTSNNYKVYYQKSCFAAGTLITLADGTQKKVEDLLESDVLLVFDHETGTYVECPILFIERDGWAEYNIINLTFSNGTTTRLIYEHGLFDLTLNRYVYVTEQNYSEFVGHEFAVMDENGYQTVTLTEAYITTEYTGCYSLVTVYHFNYFIDGLFSMPGGIDGLFNFFEYDESLKFDEEKMAEDIKKYGLYTYEDFAPYMPEEIYELFQAPYYKVAVEKGMITFEEIVGLIERYLVQHGIV